jgi:hypothetical protein
LSGSSGSQEIAAQLSRNTLLSAILVALKSLGIQIGAKSTTATAGSASLPSAPAGFVTLTFSDGSSGKVPYYNS